MFIAVLFTIGKTWKQPKCPPTDEWIKNMWHIYTMEYYSTIKRNEIELFVVRWMCLFELWFSLGMCPVVRLLDHMVVLFLVF